MQIGDKAKALTHFTRLKDDYKSSSQANGVDALIGMAQN